MALTDVFISPAGAGSKDGSSVANALQAIDSGDWSTDIEGLDCANKRFVFLTGTYNVTTNLVFSGSAASNTQPNQWVGADASGNILRPKFDETGLRLDLTDYPKFVMSENVEIITQNEDTFYKCLSFENTNSGYSLSAIIDSSTADADRQGWVGCSFKANCQGTNAEVMVGNNTYFHTCVFESVGDIYDRIFDGRNTHINNCRFIGPSTSGSGGDGDGYTVTSGNGSFINCIITRVHGHGYIQTSTNDRTSLPGPTNCTIVNVGGDGFNDTSLDGTSNASNYMPGPHNTLIYGAGAYGMNVAATDTRQNGPQIMAMGSNSSGNFNNMDSYEDMIDVITVTSADFVDLANLDLRIRRDSPLYKLYGVSNLGGMQNEDYEFTSVS
jgi:hypothetical protein